MSVPVEVTELAPHLAERGPVAYVLTVGDDARAHVVSVVVAREGDRFTFEAGNRTRANAAARPLVSLMWPARPGDDYSLIVDGEAAIDGDAVVVTATRAVLHRVAGADAAGTTLCVPLDLGAG